MLIPMKGIISSNDDAEVYELFGYSTVTPSAINNALSELNGENVSIEINSPGGDVFAGSEIFTALKAYQGKVEVRIVGLAASAASIIAMAGDTVKISPTAQLMIHRASTSEIGNSDELASGLQRLDETDQAMAAIYCEKTGLDIQTIYQMMVKETWINAENAVKQGFADEILFASQPVTVVNTVQSLILNQEVVQKVKTLIRKAENTTTRDKNNLIETNKSQLKQKKLAILFGKKTEGDVE